MINVIVVKAGLVDENILCKNEQEAREVVKKFDAMLDKNSPTIDEIFSRGFTWVTGGAICISDPQTVNKLADVCSEVSATNNQGDRSVPL